MKFIRLLIIIITFKRFNLYQILHNYHKTNLFTNCLEYCLFFIPINPLIKNNDTAVNLRLAFEKLGPVFIKFGQLLSTRADILADNYIKELSKLQSQVPPFDNKIAIKIIEDSLQCKLEDIFDIFDIDAVAAASIAQVHKARLRKEQQIVAIKVIRPNIAKIIKQDIAVLNLCATLITICFQDGKRLKPKEVVQEFNNIIHAELDFLQEAANATKLRELHAKDQSHNIIMIPKVYYDYSSSDVLVLEWMNGTPIAAIDILKQKNIDLEKLSHDGVTIFYTQVFHYGFFHADMHAGNILCDDLGRYIGLDFGIVGSLSEEDKRYLAINILAFFNRDYKKVALTHIQSGWAPANTKVAELESAIRTVCEPIFNKPLKDISFGKILIKLFQVSRKFNIPIQPQLILLQKTIINVEGMGRMLNPNLDLWVSAKPILEKWLRNQTGIRGLINNITKELPYWSYMLPQLPRLLANSLKANVQLAEQNYKYHKLKQQYKHNTYILFCLFGIAILCLIIIM